MSRMVFADRCDGGRFLARLLAAYAGAPDVIVLALPRGGVPVGFEVARALRAPLDFFLARKLGVPGHEELAIGAIASGGVRVLNDDVIEAVEVTGETIDRITALESAALAHSEQTYRAGRENDAPASVDGRTVILVDDGLATGSTMRAAAEALRTRAPARIVAAAPAGSARGCNAVAAVADEVVCATQPEPFVAVGLSYRKFTPTTDGEVRDLLAASPMLHG